MASTSKAISIIDTFSNLLAGFGVFGRDKVTAQSPQLRLLDPKELEALYRGDWLSRKICDLPPFDTTRAWRTWQAEHDEVEALEETERKFGIQLHLYDALRKARIWGGAAMLLGVDGTGEFDTELNVEDVKKDSLKFVHVLSGGRSPLIAPGPRIRDITSPYYGEPSYYQRTNVPVQMQPGLVQREPDQFSGSRMAKEGVFYIHPSRVIRMVGAEYPDIEMAADGWGDSVLQVVYDAIQGASMVNSSLATMISEAKLDIIKVQNLSEMLATQEGTKKVLNRYINANTAKSVVNSLLIDKDSEDWVRHELRLTGIDKVQATYLLIAAGAADIPATRLLGREPAGMNATGESDLRNYYDRLSAEQNVKLRPLLSRLDEVLIRHTFGDRDPNIHYHWNPLWQHSDQEKADVEFKLAQAHQIDVAAGLIEPIVLKAGRENHLIESGFLYPGIETAIDELGSDEYGEMLNEAGLAGLEQTINPPEPVMPGAGGGKPNGGGGGGNGARGGNGSTRPKPA